MKRIKKIERDQIKYAYEEYISFITLSHLKEWR